MLTFDFTYFCITFKTRTILDYCVFLGCLVELHFFSRGKTSSLPVFLHFVSVYLGANLIFGCFFCQLPGFSNGEYCEKNFYGLLQQSRIVQF